MEPAGTAVVRFAHTYVKMVELGGAWVPQSSASVARGRRVLCDTTE